MTSRLACFEYARDALALSEMEELFQQASTDVSPVVRFKTLALLPMLPESLRLSIRVRWRANEIDPYLLDALAGEPTVQR